MKTWYQLRYEELGLVDFQFWYLFDKSVSIRLKEYLFGKIHFGGIKWVYSCCWTDYRAIYGHDGEAE